MNKLIQNANWQHIENNVPKYFCNSNVSLDRFEINGCRTSSVCQDCSSRASAQYTPAINVNQQAFLQWGCTIRAIEVQSVDLVACFYNRAGKKIRESRKSIEKQISHEFCCHTARFRIPSGAETVRLSIEFKGKTTACTFYAPTAFFC